MKTTIKRYIISTIITFLSGALPVIIATMDSVDTFADLNRAMFIGAVFAGVRLVLKSLTETIQHLTKK